MESGNIVEYIDRQKIVCAVVLEAKNQRLRLLTESNREVKLSEGRLSHSSKTRLDLSVGRDRLVEAAKKAADRRKTYAEQIDIKELWEVLNTEQEWIDLHTMTDFCFPNNSDGDHESAVVRAFFHDKLYFKFNTDRFFPNTQEQVGQIEYQANEAARKNRITEEGANWLKSVMNNTGDTAGFDPERTAEYIEILESVYLFDKESKHYELGKAMLAKAGIAGDDVLFDVFVKAGVWDKDENLELRQFDIPVSFSDEIMAQSAKLIAENLRLKETCLSRTAENESPVMLSLSELSDMCLSGRRDLTMLPLITIDGQATLDFDDALSIENKGDHYCLGIHIADVGHSVRKGDPIDREALVRGSSIYLPDQKIPMLPPDLAEDICSLKAGELRPAVSTLVKLSLSGDILGYEIVPSLIRVKHQLNYNEVNQMAEEDKDISLLYDIAKKFRQKRLNDGAIQISLPEINLWVDENGELNISRTNRESPGRLLVAELMIMANWMMAKFLADHNLPAIFRSQPGPKTRLYKDDDGTLFQNWMQRKLLSRFVLSHNPERHAGLGLEAYLTATSPIRKYSDLITQRQIRSVFGLETPLTAEDIDRVIHLLEHPMSCVSKIQYRRKRYWLLKYLEGRIGEKEEAVVLSRRKNDYLILITEYMTECNLPISGGVNLKPEDLIQITVQHVNARKDVLTVFMG